MRSFDNFGDFSNLCHFQVILAKIPGRENHPTVEARSRRSSEIRLIYLYTHSLERPLSVKPVVNTAGKPRESEQCRREVAQLS